MSVIWFNSLNTACTKSPGRWRSKIGFLYIILFEGGAIKIGSSVHPGRRIMESYWTGKAKVAVLDIGRRFRKAEKEMHLILRPLNHARGVDLRTEMYPKPSHQVRRAILRCIKTKVSDKSLRELRDVVESTENY